MANLGVTVSFTNVHGISRNSLEMYNGNYIQENDYSEFFTPLFLLVGKHSSPHCQKWV